MARCGECRLGLGVHNEADPLCDHNPARRQERTMARRRRWSDRPTEPGPHSDAAHAAITAELVRRTLAPVTGCRDELTMPV